MELSVKITATQLKKGMKTFLGQEVKSQKENPFCFVPANGDNVRINEGFWLVEYHDGYREVWTTEQIKKNAKPIEKYDIDLDALEKVAGDKNITTEEVMDLVFKSGITISSEQPQSTEVAEDVRIEDEDNENPQSE